MPEGRVLPNKRLMFLGCTLGLFLVLALGLTDARAQGTGQGLPYDEEEAQSIGRMLMCPVCAGTSIEQSQAQIAQQMRELVREMLAQGTHRDEILDFFLDRYGVEVLAAPPKSGVNLLAWILPVVGVLAALLGGVAVIRAMTARSGGAMPVEPAVDEGLDPYLEAIDRDLDLRGNLAVDRAPVDTPRSEPRSQPNNGTSTASERPYGGVEPHREEGFSQDG